MGAQRAMLTHINSWQIRAKAARPDARKIRGLVALICANRFTLLQKS